MHVVFGAVVVVAMDLIAVSGLEQVQDVVDEVVDLHGGIVALSRGSEMSAVAGGMWSVFMVMGTSAQRAQETCRARCLCRPLPQSLWPHIPE